MKQVYVQNAYKKDHKLARRRGDDLDSLQTVIELLATDKPLPARCNPHKLSGSYKGLWECHIKPDWLLIYGIEIDSVILYRLGTHSDLFD